MAGLGFELKSAWLHSLKLLCLRLLWSVGLCQLHLTYFIKNILMQGPTAEVPIWLVWVGTLGTRVVPGQPGRVAPEWSLLVLSPGRVFESLARLTQWKLAVCTEADSVV